MGQLGAGDAPLRRPWILVPNPTYTVASSTPPLWVPSDFEARGTATFANLDLEDEVISVLDADGYVDPQVNLAVVRVGKDVQCAAVSDFDGYCTQGAAVAVDVQ